MERITTRMSERHVEELDQLVADGHYPSRSEAVRAYVRAGLQRDTATGRNDRNPSDVLGRWPQNPED